MLKCSACYIEVHLVKKNVVVVELKVNGMDRGVCCVQFRVFSSPIVWGKKLSLSRLVRVQILRNHLPEGIRENSPWLGWLESLMILRVSSCTAWCRCPGGREAHLLQCGRQFALGVDRLSAWPIIGADIKHFTDYRYRPFSKHICR